MPRTCTVCRNAEHVAIDEALVAGAPRRELARRFGLSATAVCRHADPHLPKLLTEAKEAERTADAGKLLARVSGVVADLEAMAAAAKAGGDFDAFLRVVRELRGGLELLGRVTGGLQAGNVTVLVAIEQQLGAPLDVAQKAVALYRSVEGTTMEERDMKARKYLTLRGWRCVPPSDSTNAANPLERRVGPPSSA
jgi:hypothetical protein